MKGNVFPLRDRIKDNTFPLMELMKGNVFPLRDRIKDNTFPLMELMSFLAFTLFTMMTIVKKLFNKQLVRIPLNY